MPWWNGVNEWDDHTFTKSGSRYIHVDYSVNWTFKTWKRLLCFGNYPEANVIQSRTYWRYLIGGTLAEFDHFNGWRFRLGRCNDRTRQDGCSEHLHSWFGHGLGLSDIYTWSVIRRRCFGIFKWRRSSEEKLESGDIAGLKKLYGS